MPRVQSNGIKYFSFDVDFFSDPKVKILKARYGTDGIAIYLYCLCLIYREGYYVKVDDDLYYVISDELKLSTETVEQVMTFLLKRSMLNEQLFKSDAILTGTGIQDRWQKAVKNRAQKTPIVVSDYWLLGREETEPFIKCTLFEDNSEKNEDNSEKNNDNSEKNNHKVNKSKVESKVEVGSTFTRTSTSKNSSCCYNARERIEAIFFEKWKRKAMNIEIDALLDEVSNSGVTEELLTLALTIAAEAGKATVSYVRGIFRNWENAGVKTPEEYEEYKSKKENGMKRKKKEPLERGNLTDIAAAEKLRELNRRK